MSRPYSPTAGGAGLGVVRVCTPREWTMEQERRPVNTLLSPTARRPSVQITCSQRLRYVPVDRDGPSVFSVL